MNYLHCYVYHGINFHSVFSIVFFYNNFSFGRSRATVSAEASIFVVWSRSSITLLAYTVLWIDDER